MTESPTAVTCPATNPGARRGQVVVVVVVDAVVVGRLIVRCASRSDQERGRRTRVVCRCR